MLLPRSAAGWGNQVTSADFYACGRPESGSERRHGRGDLSLAVRRWIRVSAGFGRLSYGARAERNTTVGRYGCISSRVACSAAAASAPARAAPIASSQSAKIG